MRIEFQFYLIHTLIGNFDKQTNNKRHAYPINLIKCRYYVREPIRKISRV